MSDIFLLFSLGFFSFVSLFARKYKRGPMPNPEEWCFTWIPRSTGLDRAALMNDARWQGPPAISIAFLEGSANLKKRVRAAAMIWLEETQANVAFNFRDNKDADIRISFSGLGSWSALGQRCRRIPRKQPTMNFGYLNDYSGDKDVRSMVLHEFGHALGLIHEHQS